MHPGVHACLHGGHHPSVGRGLRSAPTRPGRRRAPKGCTSREKKRAVRRYGRGVTDNGYFQLGSTLRYVQSHRVVGQTYGQRALILGATHPVAYQGTSQSSLARERPFERLARTARVFETVFFGSRAEADKVLAAVRAMHGRVSGSLDQDAGRWPAGTPYDAFDPELMLWTMAVLADSSRVAFETLVRPLRRHERESLWQDWVRFGELFGMPRDVAPRSSRDFERWMAEQLAGPRFVVPEALVVGRAIAHDTPVPPGPVRAGIRVTNHVVVGMLPAGVRELFGLPWSWRDEALFRAEARAVRSARLVVPRSIARGGNRALFEMVIATERHRVARGRPSMDLPGVAPAS